MSLCVKFISCIILVSVMVGCKKPALVVNTKPYVMVDVHCKFVDDKIVVNMQVPNHSGMNIWNVDFVGEKPECFTIYTHEKHTVLSWCAPRSRISDADDKPYILNFSSVDYCFEARISLRTVLSRVSELVLRPTLLPLVR